jgi:HlyD family secretion protein
MTVQDINNLTFQLPFNDVTNIQVGQKADVTITDLGASGVTGKVTKVNRAAVADTNGTLVYYVTIMIGNPGALVPGMQAQAVVHTVKGAILGYNTGSLEWAATTTVRAGVAGNLTQLNVDENTVVKKGQLLASLNSDTLKSQVNSQSLKLQQSQLSIAGLQKELADYMIYAPADGTFTMNASSNTSGTNQNSSSSSSSTGVSDKWQVGDEVKAGQIVGIIDDAAGLVVTVSIDEVDIAKIKLGQKADITFDALPDQKFTGTVSDISDVGVVSNSAATFDVKVALDKTDGVKTGMTANVEILVNHKEGALLVPIEAVQDRNGRKFVILDNGGATDASRSGSDAGFGGSSRAGSAMTGRMTRVETGLYNETLIEITNGIKEGDKVVLPTVARSTGNSSGIRMPIGGGMGGGREVYTGGGNRPGGGGDNR